MQQLAKVATSSTISTIRRRKLALSNNGTSLRKQKPYLFGGAIVGTGVSSGETRNDFPSLGQIGQNVSLLLTGTENAIYSIGKTVERWNRILRCTRSAFAIAVDYKWSLFRAPDEKRDSIMSVVHKRSAERLLHLFQLNGGIFIKVGQHMHALTYLLPSEYTDTMSPLLDKNPHVSFSSVKELVEKELGKSIEDTYDWFEEVPTSSASLAQVHKASYKGQHVAVKVQYPGLQEQCWGDAKTVERLVSIATLLFPEFKLQWLVKEFNKNLPAELDFYHEAENGQKLVQNFKSSKLRKFVAVPTPVWELTTPRVLTMEWIDGCKANDVECIKAWGIDPAQVGKRMIQIFCEQMYFHGFVHCDPHPGNIFVRKIPGDFQLVLLDNGLYRTLDDKFRLSYASLWLSLLKANEADIKKNSLDLGVKDYKLFSSMLTTRSWER